MNEIRTVVMIGAGRVAWSLAPCMQQAGYNVRQVFSRRESSCRELAERLACGYATAKDDMAAADLYVCCVSDDAIEAAVSGIDFGDSMVVHTAGSVPMDALKPHARRYGVLYPMQTFSKQKSVSGGDIPFYVEGCDEEAERELMDFASSLGSKAVSCDSRRRMQLHIAAVFASNFANHMYALADEIMRENGLDFSDLLPLIDLTAEKVHSLSPAAGQSGPAVRRDEKVLQKQAASLSGRKKEIYELLSRSIQELDAK